MGLVLVILVTTVLYLMGTMVLAVRMKFLSSNRRVTFTASFLLMLYLIKTGIEYSLFGGNWLVQALKAVGNFILMLTVYKEIVLICTEETVLLDKNVLLSRDIKDKYKDVVVDIFKEGLDEV